jgi:hypothetical protein
MHHGLKLCLILVLISILLLMFGIAEYNIMSVPSKDYYMIGMFILQLSSWFIVVNPHFID